MNIYYSNLAIISVGNNKHLKNDDISIHVVTMSYVKQFLKKICLIVKGSP